MKKSLVLVVVLSISLFFLVACKSAKVQRQPSNSKSAIERLSKCDQTIRHYADKLRGSKGGHEVYANTEIVISPSAKLINLKSAPPDEEKVDFNIGIETSACDLNADLTAGGAIYKGSIIQKDGTTTPTILKVEASSGGIIISGLNPNNDEEGLDMYITKREVVRD